MMEGLGKPRFHALCGEVSDRYADGSCKRCVLTWHRAYDTVPEHRAAERARRATPSQRAKQRQYAWKRTGMQYRLDTLIEQQGLCAACLKGLDLNDAEIDHDHTCSNGCGSISVWGQRCGHCERGIIHQTCNQALGLFFDDPASLRHAADYLQGQTA